MTEIPEREVNLKVSLSPCKKLYSLQWKLFKNQEKRFLFHLKSSFHSQINSVFNLDFLLI